MKHIALLGDSVFDNGAYTPGQPDVVTHLRQVLPAGVRASLLAVDGATTADVRRQVAELPPDVDGAAVSIGGNDALRNTDALDLPVASTADALRLFGQRIAVFEEGYREALSHVIRRVPHTAVCTIYNANFPADEAALVRVGLALFNDVILRVAFERRLPVVDLRLVCVEPSDYANAIEPSSQGAAKIARSVVAAVGIVPSSAAGSVITTSA